MRNKKIKLNSCSRLVTRWGCQSLAHINLHGLYISTWHIRTCKSMSWVKAAISGCVYMCTDTHTVQPALLCTLLQVLTLFLPCHCRRWLTLSQWRRHSLTCTHGTLSWRSSLRRWRRLVGCCAMYTEAVVKGVEKAQVKKWNCMNFCKRLVY